jgi:hypothetical protein
VRGKRAMLHEHMGCQVVTPQCRKHRLSVQHKARSQAFSANVHVLKDTDRTLSTSRRLFGHRTGRPAA